MNELRADLAPVIAQDHRYSVDAYLFVFEALEFTIATARQGPRRPSVSHNAARAPKREHVSGRDLCMGARKLLATQYGMMALTVARSWGIFTTADIGSIVFNLIRAGELDAQPTDSQSDFDDVFDLSTVLDVNYEFASDSDIV